MLVRKWINLKAPLTEEQKAELAALREMSDEDIVYDEDCPPTTEEQVNCSIYLMKKYNTRRITKEILEMERRSQLTG